MNLLREALFTSVRTVKTGMLVRRSVRKVNTFCEEDMRGDHVPVGKGVLNDRFLGFEKFWKFLEIFGKKVLKVYISMRIAHSQNPVLNQS